MYARVIIIPICEWYARTCGWIISACCCCCFQSVALVVVAARALARQQCVRVWMRYNAHTRRQYSGSSAPAGSMNLLISVPACVAVRSPISARAARSYLRIVSRAHNNIPDAGSSGKLVHYAPELIESRARSTVGVFLQQRTCEQVRAGARQHIGLIEFLVGSSSLGMDERAQRHVLLMRVNVIINIQSQQTSCQCQQTCEF